jgi:hypothetical protein
MHVRALSRMRGRRKRDFALGLSTIIALVGLIYVGVVTGVAEAPPPTWPALFWLRLAGTYLLILIAIINVLSSTPKWYHPFLAAFLSLPWVVTFSSHFSNSGWSFLTISSALAILCHLIVAGWIGVHLIRARSNGEEEKPTLDK